MRSLTDRLVLAGLAILGMGLVSLGTGKAIAHYTIAGTPSLNIAAEPVEETAISTGEDGGADLVRLVEGTRQPGAGVIPR